MGGFHELHYVEWGAPDAPRVTVCAHGYSGNGRDFDFLAHALSAESRVICPDVAGRGDSDWLATPLSYHFAQFLADLNALIARLGVKRVDWVGTSMGGLLGMLLAAMPASPIRRLVMNDVGAFLPAGALGTIRRHLNGPARFASLEAAEQHLRRTHSEWGDLTDAQWAHLARHRTRRVDGAWRLHYDPQLARVLQPVAFTPGIFFWDAWYRVRCPVLLLRGSQSEVFPRSVADIMLVANPQAKLLEIEGCGHAPALMSEPQIRIVRDFLGASEARAAQRRAA